MFLGTGLIVALVFVGVFIAVLTGRLGSTRAGVTLLVIGVVVAVVGTAQLPLTVWLSGDPTLNPVGNGILMWLSWAVAGLFFVIGAAVALIGRMRGAP
jgi:hypothetical protein